MSEEALIASIRLEMEMKRAAGKRVSSDHARRLCDVFFARKGMKIDTSDSMKCSNYVGETLDSAVALGFRGILFVAHIGKFIKVSGGIMNTHSRSADCRAELMAAQALRAGADPETVRRILDTITTEEALDILKEKNLAAQTMREILPHIPFTICSIAAGAR